MSHIEALAALVEKHCPQTGRRTPLPGLTLMRADERPPALTLHMMPALCLVLRGSKTTRLGETDFRYRPGQYLISSVDLPVTSQINEAPYLAIAISLESDTVSDLMLNSAGVTDPLDQGRAMAVSDVDDDLGEAVLRYVRLLERPDEVSALGPYMMREIVYRLLRGDQNGILRQLGVFNSRIARINRAIRFIRANYAQAIRIETLAELAHMSVSVFHKHFKGVTTMSPLRFQQHLRLQEARRRLLAGEAEVSSIGYAVGYESPSQFSREYARMFGTPPGRDGQVLRSVMTPERSAV